MATTDVLNPTGFAPFDTNMLIQVVPNLKRPTSFLLDRFFPNSVISDTEFISIDIDIGKRRMSPFVSPMAEGKMVEQRRMQTNVFKPAYVKDKRAPDLRKPIRRMIGEQIGGSMSGAEREMANLNFEMEDQLDMITRRQEWMAAQVLLNGTLYVAGEGFDPVTIDFGRDSTLSVALSGSTKWTLSNIAAGSASPTQNIEAWQRQILKKSGAKATDIVFTTSAWLAFLADPLLKGSLFYPSLAGFGNAVDPGAKIERGAIHKGKWGGYDLWVYNEWFVATSIDASAGLTDNKEYPMLTDGTVIVSGPDMMGTRAYGQILDPYFNYAGLAYAPKTWVEEDPAQRVMMMQSSPLVIPSRANAALGATVCDPVYDT